MEFWDLLRIFDFRPGVYDSNLIVNKGVSVTDYFKQKMQAKLQKPAEKVIEDQNKEFVQDQQEEFVENQKEETENVVKEKKKKKRKLEKVEVIEVVESADDIEEKPVKKSNKKKQKESSDSDCEIVEKLEEVEEPPKKKKKSKKCLEEVQEVVEEIAPEKSKKKKKNKKEPEEEKVVEIPEEAEKSSKKKKNSPTKPSGEPERGANAVYSTNIIQIPSHVAQKLSSMSIDGFKNSNLANIVGYGLTDNIEIRTVQTKIGQGMEGTNKYSLYNTDRMTTRQRQNPRKIFSKLKKTKKSIQVIWNKFLWILTFLFIF